MDEFSDSEAESILEGRELESEREMRVDDATETLLEAVHEYAYAIDFTAARDGITPARRPEEITKLLAAIDHYAMSRHSRLLLAKARVCDEMLKLNATMALVDSGGAPAELTLAVLALRALEKTPR